MGRLFAPAHAAPQLRAAPARIGLLVETFERIGRERMAGVPLLHPGLRVEAVGFERACGPGEDESGWLGVLVTPWFMNLLWWPDEARHAAAPGRTRLHALGGERYAFLGAHESALGAFEMCSLVSPMELIADQDAARALAREVLRLLRTPAAAPAVPPQPSRRAFLRGALRPPPAGGSAA